MLFILGGLFCLVRLIILINWHWENLSLLSRQKDLSNYCFQISCFFSSLCDNHPSKRRLLYDFNDIFAKLLLINITINNSSWGWLSYESKENCKIEQLHRINCHILFGLLGVYFYLYYRIWLESISKTFNRDIFHEYF